MKLLLSVGVSFLLLQMACTQETATDQKYISYNINSNVQNAEEPYAKAIYKNWQDYLNGQTFMRQENPFWFQEDVVFADYAYANFLFDLRTAIRDEKQIQCVLLGLVPLENDYYLMKTMYPKVDEEGQVDLKYMLTVYAKRIGTDYKFISGVQYHKAHFENIKVGSVNYIIHPEHHFNLEEATKMDAFNNRIAKLYQMDPIQFDYFLANNTTDMSNMMGTNFFHYSYQAVRSGGMADNYNQNIFAGNNSAYYPHEVVHLYNHHKVQPRNCHQWIDEGIAAFFGGSTGYDIEWHWFKLKEYLQEHPDFNFETLDDIPKTIPNGEYMTDFMYAIGGLLMAKVFEQEGMEGLFDALDSGRSEEDYFGFLKEKLMLDKSSIVPYLKDALSKLEFAEDLAVYEY
ncbi:MAG: hypothetical protein AAGK97_02965 [Bacteroidota bacterium]